MNRTLGLDLGSNSLGWAILDDFNGDIVDKGVVVFPEGMDMEAKSSIDTRAALRRAARMGRRMKFRRKLRKWNLLKLLTANGMCPLTQTELEAWKKDGKYPVENKEFIDWLKATDSHNPYCDRAAAAEGKVEPFVLGRALYHICQRRGFRSSRKEEAAAIDEKTGEIRVDDKKLGAVKSDISHLTEEIASSGAKTLGQYFFKCLQADLTKSAKRRIRARYTGRNEHYIAEFNVIMDAQGFAKNHALRESLYKAIFMQRPLRSQKHLVGNCPLELEHRHSRAQIGHPAFEEYRMRAFVNNLSFETETGERVPLTKDDRELVCTAFMKAASSIKFSDISKLFKKDPRFKINNYKFRYYRDDDTVSTCQTTHKLNQAFGSLKYDVQKVFDALTFFDDTEKLVGWVKKHYPALDEKSARKVASIHPKEGNAQYSLKAINRILPFLREGFELSQARFFAKLPDIIPDFAAHKDEIILHLNEILFNYRKDKAEFAELAPTKRKLVKSPAPLYDRYRDYLFNNWNVDDKLWNKLYLHGDDQYEPELSYKCKGKDIQLAQPRLPPVKLGMMRNPLVQRAMTTLRRLVNYLGEHGKLDPEDTIRIELARSVNDFATRKAYQDWQKKRETKRQEAKTEIEKYGVKVTEDAIERYVLWDEQGRKCLYTGRNISITDLLSGNAFDVEHTIPRSMSGDDSLANKTICEAIYNRQVKMGRVPRDCPNWNEIDVRLGFIREKVEQLAKDVNNQLRSARNKTEPTQRSQARVKALSTKMELNYWRDKLRRFEIDAEKLKSGDGELGGFKKRQLVDTGIMCSHAVALLKSVYPRTFAVNGTATAFARKAWGIQGDEAKDRTEHTHHAKDAMVIAALTPARFTAICTALKDDGALHRRECDVCPEPYPNFAAKVRVATEEILVKHILRQTTLRQSSKQNALAHAHRVKGDPNGRIIKYVKSQGDTVRGQLHLDTFYGCIVKPGTEEQVKVVRKPLVGPVASALAIVDKIVDPTIREIVSTAIEKLQSNGIKNIEAGMIKMPSGVPVNKVRVFASNATNASILRDHTMESDKDYKRHYYVTSAPGSNFRLGVFCVDGKYSVEPDNSLTWAQNHKKPDYIPLDTKPGFLGYITPGSMALLHHEGHPEELKSMSQKELCKRLYKVVKFENTGRTTLRYHSEARASVVLANAIKEANNGKYGAGFSYVDFLTPKELLLLNSNTYLRQFCFENIHFMMMIDGTIKFLDSQP